MLIRFSVENHLCFGERACLDLAEPTPVALLFGENAAGKTSLQKALSCVRSLVLGGSRPGQPLPVTPHLGAPPGPSRFELTLRQGDTLFTYGFAATTQKVEEEWLLEQREAGQPPATLFTRRGGKPGSPAVSVELGEIAASDRPRLELVAYGTRPEQLFLNEALRRGVTRFMPVAIWLRDRVQLILSETKVVGLAARAAREPAFAEFLGRFLEESGTGVVKAALRREPLAPDTFETEEEERELVAALTSFPDAFAETSDGELIAEQGGRRVELSRVRLFFTLDGTQAGRSELPVQALSDGTQRLLHLAPLFYGSSGSAAPVYFLDDLPRGLHPRLMRRLLARFSELGPRAGQLIATVHDPAPFVADSAAPLPFCAYALERTPGGVRIRSA